jgi:hypothetical protein
MAVNRYAHTLRYLKSVVIKFDPFDPRKSCAREFLRQAMGGKLASTNPKCTVTYEISDCRADPAVRLVYGDNTEERIPTVDRTIKDVFGDLERLNFRMAQKGCKPVIADGII